MFVSRQPLFTALSRMQLLVYKAFGRLQIKPPSAWPICYMSPLKEGARSLKVLGQLAPPGSANPGLKILQQIGERITYIKLPTG